MIQLTKALRREISELSTPKGRRNSHAFVAEGTKCVLDTIGSFKLRYLIATRDWLDNHIINNVAPECIIEANRGVISEMSSMTLVPDVMAVYELPVRTEFCPDKLNGLIIALDRVQDPGNLGTIMRTADWMGVDTILAAVGTADCYNPKVVQATMGAISRVKVVYGDLADMLRVLKPRMPIFGTFLDGENIYTANLPCEGVIVMGHEGMGIGPEVAAEVSHRLLIPSWPAERPTSESLNVATATAITLSQFRSRQF